MMTIDQAHKELQRWYDDGCVGNLTIFRAPRSKNVDMVAEETVKLFEMDREAQELMHELFSTFGTEKLEAVCNKNGDPDRVTIVRRY
jgi:hypothetical protein